MKKCVVGFGAVIAAAVGGFVGPAHAQDAVSEVVEEVAVAAEVAADVAEPVDQEAVSPATVKLAKLTPILIEILAPLGSKTSKSLDSYRIRLAEPILVEGVEVVPAGAEGMGEVVHAKKAGGMGAAGELVLAARWLDIGGSQMRLRSMELLESQQGKSRMDTVNTLNVASAASPLPIGLIGFFIGGGNIEIPAGAFASAKLAADFEVPAPVPVAIEQPIEELSGPEGGTDVTEEGTQQ